MPLGKPKAFKSKEDVVSTAADFVIEYKDVQMFSANYKLDSHVLGEGNFFTIFSLLICFSQLLLVHAIIG